MNVNGGLEDIRWVLRMSRGREIAGDVLRSSPKNGLYCWSSERDQDFLSCFLHTSSQVFFPSYATDHRPLCEHCDPKLDGSPSRARSVRSS